VYILHKNTLFFGQFEKNLADRQEISLYLLFIFIYCARIWPLRSRKNMQVCLK